MLGSSKTISKFRSCSLISIWSKFRGICSTKGKGRRRGLKRGSGISKRHPLLYKIWPMGNSSSRTPMFQALIWGPRSKRGDTSLRLRGLMRRRCSSIRTESSDRLMRVLCSSTRKVQLKMFPLSARPRKVMFKPPNVNSLTKWRLCNKILVILQISLQIKSTRLWMPLTRQLKSFKEPVKVSLTTQMSYRNSKSSRFAT